MKRAGTSADPELLMLVAQRAGLNGSALLSTGAVAHALGASQQSASRRLRALENAGMVSRSAGARGITVSLTKKGRDSLHAQFSLMQSIFSAKNKTKKMKITGSVVSGLGEGSYYLSQQKYLAQLRDALGFTPFLGTMNLKIEEHELKNFLDSIAPIFISGFSAGGRTFGSSKCYCITVAGKAGVPKVSGAIVVPERTSHPSHIAEVIAPVNLRKKFSLRDGSALSLEAKL
ncbi:MAG: DUF120 domain-containing protein [Candidatus Diapherotrites archaeon]